MNQEGYVEAFHAWIRRNEPRLNAGGITVQVPDKIIPSGSHAEFFSEAGEATVEIWDYGFSEFHVLDSRTGGQESDGQVEVTHHEFRNEDEMFSALEDLIKRMFQTQPAEAPGKAPALAGRA